VLLQRLRRPPQHSHPLRQLPVVSHPPLRPQPWSETPVIIRTIRLTPYPVMCRLMPGSISPIVKPPSVPDTPRRSNYYFITCVVLPSAFPVANTFCFAIIQESWKSKWIFHSSRGSPQSLLVLPL
jgi:hypothetical protein